MMAISYESPITRFLKAYKKSHPDLDTRQYEARALWWDKPQDLTLLEQFRGAQVPQKPYVYQSD